MINCSCPLLAVLLVLGTSLHSLSPRAPLPPIMPQGARCLSQCSPCSLRALPVTLSPFSSHLPATFTPSCHPQATSSCVRCGIGEAGGSAQIGKCLDGFLCFPFFPWTPLFSNLNATFVFTSTFCFPSPLLFVALLKLRWRTADLLKLSGWDGQGVWDALKCMQRNTTHRTPGAALKCLFLFVRLTRTALLNWFKIKNKNKSVWETSLSKPCNFLWL